MSDENITSTKKITAIAVFVITVISTAVGLLQFFSVSELTVIRGEYSMLDKTNQGGQINLITEIANNSGKIVYFDAARIEIDHNAENMQENKTVYQFNFEELYSPKIKSNTNASDSEKINDLIEYYSLSNSEKNKSELEKMILFDMSGYNAFLFVNSESDERNHYSSSQFVAEGDAQLLDGPFQIKDTSGGEDVSFEISAPYLDSALTKQVECTKKNWHWIQKKFLCQFL